MPMQLPVVVVVQVVVVAAARLTKAVLCTIVIPTTHQLAQPVLSTLIRQQLRTVVVQQ